MYHRGALELIWRAGIARVGGYNGVREALSSGGFGKPDAIIAIGKAATPMAEAALGYCGYDTRTLVITKYDHVICHHRANQDRIEEYQKDGTLQIIESGHPLPDEKSLEAGAALVEFIKSGEAADHLLLLVSGGASALAEKLPNETSLQQLRKMTDEMLAQGLRIDEINQRRNDISLIKGGKLLAEFGGRKLSVLAISDVEGDDIKFIGSGIGMVDQVGKNIAVNSQIIASNHIARMACEQKAQMLGFEICANAETAYGEVEDVAENIAEQITRGGDGVYIFGGEPTVILPENPGKGGRNQHLALLLAKKFCNNESIEFLAAGSDGSDGPHNIAGGFGDGQAFCANAGGQTALEHADAGNYLEKCGYLFVTGPTGTNVMDLIIVIKGSQFQV